MCLGCRVVDKACFEAELTIVLTIYEFRKKWRTPNFRVYHSCFQLQLPVAALTPPYLWDTMIFCACGYDVQVISVFPGELLVSLIESLGRSIRENPILSYHIVLSGLNSPSAWAILFLGKGWYEPGGEGVIRHQLIAIPAIPVQIGGHQVPPSLRPELASQARVVKLLRCAANKIQQETSAMLQGLQGIQGS